MPSKTYLLHGLLAGAAAIAVAPVVFAKTPGTTYCYQDICHRVKTITETSAEIGMSIHMVASHYDVPWRDRFNPSLMTSSGELFRALDADTAASPVYPDGTRLLVFAPGTGGTAVLRVNDAGPYWSGRLLDVSRGAAEKLGFYRRGIAHVVVVVLSPPTLDEARYEFGRTYEPVPGYIGDFASLEDAKAAWELRPEAKTLAAALSVQAINEPHRPERVVIIQGAGSNAGTPRAQGPPGRASSSRRTRGVILKPVKLRRPHLLAVLAKRKARVAEDTKPKTKITRR